ncbi:4Fe-4S dicluster domain-containing protein [Burkholderia sp. Ac-20379]|uniref:4Fe-4S dicluster domain-containing protein n=1 Tax=Burkholderia sp. Ac-20379 TaxID=2703900 RepID=UPI00197F08B7|nr:ferredoxin family protein [Burkholderia sp. Ac-20379]MBN3727095.1 ferredoxin family protein [Burkholderia sp. Ac-20379]
MIEIISDANCTGCDICVRVCPTNVFDAVPGGVPLIARQADCQTCFMCELYCPADALYVAPQADAIAPAGEAGAAGASHFGRYRAALGWGPGRRSTADLDANFQLLTPIH